MEEEPISEELEWRNPGCFIQYSGPIASCTLFLGVLTPCSLQCPRKAKTGQSFPTGCMLLHTPLDERESFLPPPVRWHPACPGRPAVPGAALRCQEELTSMKVRLRALAALGLGLLFLAALPGQAQESGGAPEPVRFLLETITVSGANEAAANIIRAEALLEEGGSYTEANLVQAIARVHRLPFVLEATFALKKGSERGAYELAIDVQPARWFFFDQWSHGFQF